MHGLKNFLNESLQRKLSVTLSLAILGVALVAGVSPSSPPTTKPTNCRTMFCVKLRR